VRPVSGTTQTYYTPTQARSQISRPSTASLQEEINRAINPALSLKVRVSELQSMIEAQHKAAEDGSTLRSQGASMRGQERRLSGSLIGAA
jgi:hypothetical protein